MHPLLRYGLSETGGATQQQSMTWEDLKQQLGSCGPAYPATELMVRSIETGKRAFLSSSHRFNKKTD